MYRRTNGGAITRTYRFWARPRGPIPSELWQVAKESQRFWNQLVEVRENVAFTIETLPEHAQVIGERLRDLLVSRETDCKKWRAETKRGINLPSATRDFIFDRFVNCCVRAAKKQCGWPRFHKGLERIMILHRFAGGGRTVEKLFIDVNQRGWRFGLKSVSASAYTGKIRQQTNGRLSSGFFGLSKTGKIEFKTVLHRRLPLDSVVKTIAWLRRLDPIRGWQWAIAITVRVDSPLAKIESLPKCGIDFGWRTRKDYVRVGMLRDSEGHAIELRLPLDASTSNTRRHQTASNYRDLLKIDADIGNRVDDAKACLRQLVDLPNDLQRTIKDLSDGRQAGLVRLSDAFKMSDKASEAQEILHNWMRENNRLRSIRGSLQGRLIGRRRWLYRNIAAFLTRRYGTIVFEDEFAAKEIIEDNLTKDRDLPFRRSIRYYHWAAVAELRKYIVEAAAKNSARIVQTHTRGTTTTCFICGRYTEHQPNIKLTCPSGHTWDQDVNAASNVLRAIDGRGLLERSRTKAPKMAIPDALTKVMVRLTEYDDNLSRIRASASP